MIFLFCERQSFLDQQQYLSLITTTHNSENRLKNIVKQKENPSRKLKVEDKNQKDQPVLDLLSLQMNQVSNYEPKRK